jgi:hypothetical protein
MQHGTLTYRETKRGKNHLVGNSFEATGVEVLREDSETPPAQKVDLCVCGLLALIASSVSEFLA